MHESVRSTVGRRLARYSGASVEISAAIEIRCGNPVRQGVAQVRIVCVGGGPAGLYFASLARLRLPGCDVTVIERNPAGVTYGWGVVFGEALLAGLHRADPISARQIAAAATRWRDQHVRIGSRDAVHLGGYGYAIGRRGLLDILATRAMDLGVSVEYEREVTDSAMLADADLVVACDGVHSRLRQRDATEYGTVITPGRNRYLWLGTTALFDAFTFGFEETPAGWIWFHAYRFDADTSTLIAECAPQTWDGLGFGGLDPDATTARLESIFARHLGGHGLINQARGHDAASWLAFTGITNHRWSNGNVVLMGDAAHTAHFSIGSGTTLAMDDAIALADALARHSEQPAALRAYHAARLPDVIALQTEAGNSARWFEAVDENVSQGPLDFGFSLLRRRFETLAPGEHTPRWRYGVYRATQHPALRSVREQITTARRAVLSHAR